jgi:hypothetical protein
LASAGLSPALAAKLNSSIASLSSGGAVPITLPTVGVNTDATRSALAGQLTSVFGSSKIQVPNYSGNPATTGETAGTAVVNKLQEKLKQLNDITAEIDVQRELVSTTTLALRKATEDLPAGDPGIESAKQEYIAQRVKMLALLKKSTELASDANKLI